MIWRKLITHLALPILLLAACSRPAALSPRLTSAPASSQPAHLTRTAPTGSPPAISTTPAVTLSAELEPLSTPTPGGTASIQAAPTGTGTPASPPTRTASLPPVLVKCGLTGTGAQRCEDTLLNIRFDYPAEWGRLAYFLNYARLGGLEYYYGFSQAPESLLWAGGMSRDYVLPSGEQPLGWFNGFHGLSGSAYCREIDAAFCQEINPGVLQVIKLPLAHQVCSLEEATLRQPQFELLVDLPANPAISGFMLQAYFLSPAALQALWAPLHLQPGLPAEQCGDPLARGAFDAQVSVLERQLQSGALADEDSQTALEILQRLAGSVVRH